MQEYEPEEHEEQPERVVYSVAAPRAEYRVEILSEYDTWERASMRYTGRDTYVNLERAKAAADHFAGIAHRATRVIEVAR